MAPALKLLDLKVLAAVQRPARLRAIAEAVNRGRPGWDIVSDRDVREILSGLVHLGYARKSRGGWYHATLRGDITNERTA